MAEKADQRQIAPRKWPPAIKAALRALGRSEHRIFSLPPGVTVEVVRDLDAAGLVEFRLFQLYELGDVRFKPTSTNPADWKIDPYSAWFSPAQSNGGVLANPGDDEFGPLFNPERLSRRFPRPVWEAYQDQLVPLMRLATKGKTELLHLEAEVADAVAATVAAVPQPRNMESGNGPIGRLKSTGKEATAEDLQRLAQIPDIDCTSANWLSSSDAAEECGVSPETLRTYRSKGCTAPDGMCGIDPYGRMWRKKSTKNCRAFYFDPSLPKKS